MLPHDPIEHLQQAMTYGGHRAFEIVPTILGQVIEEKLWSKRPDLGGKPFRSFEAFVTALVPEGLESSIDDLLAFCRKHKDVQALIRGEVDPAKMQGRPIKGDIVPFNPRGNSSSHALKRLKRDRPDLLARVVSGELSAHAAAIEAGFRRRTFSVPDDIKAAADAIRRHFGGVDAVAIARLIIEG